MKGHSVLERGSWSVVSIISFLLFAFCLFPILSYGEDRLVIKNGEGQTTLVITDEGGFVSPELDFYTAPMGTPVGSPRMTITSDGNIGIGTQTPAYAYELNRTGKNAAFVAKRTDGATNFMNATASYAQFGAVTNHTVRILVNSTWRMAINGDSSINMLNGASLTAGGIWMDSSSRDLKENIKDLSAEEAVSALKELNPVKYNYKADVSEKHVGFIAEDVPALVASNDRKGLSPMDIVGVLTKVVQEQQKTISTLREELNELKGRVR